MATIHQWMKDLPSIIKDWRGVILLILGMTGTSLQTWNVSSTEKEGNKKVHEVVAAFQKYPPIEKPKEIKVKTNCNDCRTMWLDDIRSLENKLEEKYHK